MAEDAGEARREDLEKIRRIHSRMGHPSKEGSIEEDDEAGGCTQEGG